LGSIKLTFTKKGTKGKQISNNTLFWIIVDSLKVTTYNYSSTIFLKSPHIGAAQYLVAQPLGTYKVALKLANGDELPTVGGFSPSIWISCNWGQLKAPQPIWITLAGI